MEILNWNKKNVERRDKADYISSTNWYFRYPCLSSQLERIVPRIVHFPIIYRWIERYRPDERNISFSFARLFFLPFASAVRLIERGREEPCHCQTGVAFQSPAPIPVFLFILRAESSFWASSSKHLLYIVSFYFTNDQTEKEKKIPMQSLIRQREWFDDFSLSLSHLAVTIKS